MPRHLIEGHVIVGGYGRTGKAAARVLRAAGIPLIAVELNHSIYTQIGADGLPGVWGDITAEEIQHTACVGDARVLLLTVPDAGSVHLAVQRARAVNPTIAVIARAGRERQMGELRLLGVDSAVQSEFEGGVEMVRQALVRYDCTPETTSKLVASVRSEFYSGQAGER
jgi:CPA2 family monovalent cation:H+ antiporter-2